MNAFLRLWILLLLGGVGLPWLTLAAPAPEGKPVGRYAIRAVPCDPTTDFQEVFLLRHWQDLPHKNQEESEERCREINRLAGRQAWTFSSHFPVMACLAFGASTVADWWSLELGIPLESTRSFYHGGPEQGCDPRMLEAEYLNRWRRHPRLYPATPLDPIQKTLVPFGAEGYGRILADPGRGRAPDPSIPGLFHDLGGYSFPMERQWLTVVHRNMGHDRTHAVIEALHRHGAVFAQLEFSPLTVPFPGGHAVAVIGYGRPRSAPHRIVLIIHDSYGDHPKTYGPTSVGGPSYRFISGRSIDTAVVFPHAPVVEAIPEERGIRLVFRNRGGRPIPIRALRLTNGGEGSWNFPAEGPTSFLIPDHRRVDSIIGSRLEGEFEADFYASPQGRGHPFSVLLPRP